MKRLVVLAAVLALAGACKKKDEAKPQSDAAGAPAPTGVVDAASAPVEPAAVDAAAAPEAPAADVAEAPMALKVRDDVGDRIARYARVPLTADLSKLSDTDRQVLAELRKAAEIMGELAFRQTWSGNLALRDELAKLEGPNAQSAKDLFRVMGGPWDRQDGYLPFVGETPHPEGSAFYPEDLTKEAFEEWVKAHPDQEQAFRGFFTVIERRDGDLVAVPYSEAYRELLEKAAASLTAAAALTQDPSLKTYLESRAAAFASNDYYQSDLDWLGLNGSLEIVMGPYETYDDGLMGYKASFEAFLCSVDPEASAKLDQYKAEVAWLERNLPIPDEHKNPNRGADIPIKVVDELYTSGQGGVMTVAFNLPNDEKVREARGFKNVMLRNVMMAKYDAILVPIAERSLPPDAAQSISFDAFFNFVLFHEISHGLGPGKITKDGRETEVRAELKDLYPAIEEAKADILSLYVQKLLADKGLLSPDVVAALPQTYVAGIFRTVRFGIHEAHGQGMVAQVNYLMEKGAIVVDAQGKFLPVADKWFDAVRDLSRDLLMLEALGDYDGAKAFLEKYGSQPPAAMPAVIESLGAGIPVDIDPIFPPL